MTTTATPTRHEIAVAEANRDPRTGRPATALQGILMLIGCCLPLLGSVLLSPILPAMQQHFDDVPGVSVWVPLVLSTPALLIAIGSPFAGAIVDKLGRRRLLIGSLIAYAILGTAPLYLNTLWAILLTRVGVGIAEAGVMTCCTALLGDYFVGTRRNRYMSLQTVVMALAATVLFAVGGAMGVAGWRAPFWLYSISLILAVLVIAFVWQPVAVHRDATAPVKLPPLPWRALVPQLAVSLLCGIAFYAIIVELPYVLDGFGVHDSTTLGIATATASLLTAIGAISFRWIAKLGVAILLPSAFALSAIGLIIVWFAPSPVVAVFGAAVSSAGNGLMFPILLIWTLAQLDYAQRGRATGWWTAAIWLGQFASPLVVAALSAAIGSLQPALGVLGVVIAVVTVVLVFSVRHHPVQSLVHVPEDAAALLPATATQQPVPES
ncbi:MAG: MFS transporter [Microbacterium sp.]